MMTREALEQRIQEQRATLELFRRDGYKTDRLEGQLDGFEEVLEWEPEPEPEKEEEET